MRHTHTFRRGGLATLLAASLVAAPMAGCEDLPGSDEQQGAVIGGLGGAAAGALIGGSDNRLLGALIGGAVGAGGGYLIGANKDKILGEDEEEAREAVERAERDPVTAAEARAATTADVNADGFVTLDEVVALEEAGMNDRQILQRLEATDQVFELTRDQQDYLTDRGISENVVNRMEDINQDIREDLLREREGVISRTPDDDGM